MYVNPKYLIYIVKNRGIREYSSIYELNSPGFKWKKSFDINETEANDIKKELKLEKLEIADGSSIWFNPETCDVILKDKKQVLIRLGSAIRKFDLFYKMTKKTKIKKNTDIIKDEFIII